METWISKIFQYLLSFSPFLPLQFPQVYEIDGRKLELLVVNHGDNGLNVPKMRSISKTLRRNDDMTYVALHYSF